MENLIVKNPYRYIKEYYEERYPCLGEKFFSYASLIAISSCLPNFEKPDGTVDSPNLHMIVIGNSGAGKTELLKEMTKISFNPKFISKITESRLESSLISLSRGTLLVNDLKRCLETPGFEKVYESAVDGFISRETSTSTVKGEVSFSSIGAGVMSDLNSKKLYGGFLIRVVPLFLIYTLEDQKKIARRISEGYYKKLNNKVSAEDIIKYYNSLIDIQTCKSEEHEPISGFIFEDKVSDIILNAFLNTLDDVGGDNKYYFRDLRYGYRFTANHAFLNYFNRKIEDGKIVTTVKDARIGRELMVKGMKRRNVLLTKPKAVKALAEMDGLGGV